MYSMPCGFLAVMVIIHLVPILLHWMTMITDLIHRRDQGLLCWYQSKGTADICITVYCPFLQAWHTHTRAGCVCVFLLCVCPAGGSSTLCVSLAPTLAHKQPNQFSGWMTPPNHPAAETHTSFHLIIVPYTNVALFKADCNMLHFWVCPHFPFITGFRGSAGCVLLCSSVRGIGLHGNNHSMCACWCWQ